MAGELTPKQIDFLKYYNDPLSDTFSNAYQSAIRADFSEEYAKNITSLMPDWLSENIGRRKRMLAKAEKRLEKSIDSKDERVALDASKFVAKTLGKDEGYTERNELTGKGGEALNINVVSYADSNTLPVSTERISDTDI